jgi:hypothetical protein
LTPPRPPSLEAGERIEIVGDAHSGPERIEIVGDAHSGPALIALIEHTVKLQLTSIYRKLGVANRAGAVRHALQHEMVARGLAAPIRRPGAPRPRPAPRGRCA